MTIYEFCTQNRVEVIFNKQGKHECYINFEEGDRPLAVASNALDAIDAGVQNYLNRGKVPYTAPAPTNSLALSEKEENERLRLFLSKEALFIWYFYAKKYGKGRIVTYYEQLAQNTHPSYMNILRFIYDKVHEAVNNPNAKITDSYPALNNIFIQALVYHESLGQERYENNKIISDMQRTLKAEDKEAFGKIQETIIKVEEEIQKITEE